MRVTISMQVGLQLLQNQTGEGRVALSRRQPTGVDLGLVCRAYIYIYLYYITYTDIRCMEHGAVYSTIICITIHGSGPTKTYSTVLRPNNTLHLQVYGTIIQMYLKLCEQIWASLDEGQPSTCLGVAGFLSV